MRAAVIVRGGEAGNRRIEERFRRFVVSKGREEESYCEYCCGEKLEDVEKSSVNGGLPFFDLSLDPQRSITVCMCMLDNAECSSRLWSLVITG